MKNKNIITFALLGLAVGTAAYYLLSTDDGKKKIKEAEKGIQDLAKSLKKISKKSAKKVSEIAKNCKTELENVKISKLKES